MQTLHELSELEPSAKPVSQVRVDAERWPDVAALPSGGLRSAIAKRLFARAVKPLPVRVEMPDGTCTGTSTQPTMRVNRPTALYRRLAAGGLIGFGESYMAGDWDADNLPDMLTVFAERLSTLIPPSLQRFRALAVRRHPESHTATKENSKAHIAAHYDLSNDLFATFLDPTLTYSAALFDDAATANWDDLPAAQVHKIDRLLDRTGVTEGTRLLEIGTGWGELALRAAARGAHVTTLTLSAEQAALARSRVDEAGYAERVDIRLQDYRDATGEYDAVVSVEMIEAVGYENWPEYFRTLDRLCAPGGAVGIQAITMPDDRLEATKRTYTWIQKYIFPGGMLPSVPAIKRIVAAHTGLEVVDQLDFGAHYAATLRLWRARFESRAAEVDALGFDEVFRRMWSLYLAYSEAGFRSGYLDVQQFVLRRTK